METIGFIGAGPVGTTFAAGLCSNGYKVIGVADINYLACERFTEYVSGCKIFKDNQELADAAEMVFITTGDDFISKVSSALQWRAGQVVVHCSGATTVAALNKPKEQGANVGSIHPCQSFASVEQAVENLPGSTFAIEAEEPVKSILTRMANALKGEIVYLSSDDKVLYHAAAAIACNYFVVLEKIATDLWSHFGKESSDAVKAYMPLLRGTLSNIEIAGFPKCLTGPIARGDVETIKRHISAIGKAAPNILPLYKLMGQFAIPIGLAKGSLSEANAKSLENLLGN